MNKLFIYRTALFLFMAFFAASCTKMLEEEPQNKLKPHTVNDYDELLNNGYPSAGEYFDQKPLDFYTAMMTDDVNLDFYNKDRLPYPMIPFSFANTHDDPQMLGGYDQAWKYWYRAIYYANVVVNNVDNAAGDLVKKSYVKGEALCLRAFAYFKLVNLYGKPYDESTAESDPGVPLKLDPAVQSESYTRASVKEIYDQINKDLDEGLALMKANDINVTNKFKLNPLSAGLLASRIALFQKHYDKVIEHASEVITNNSSMFDLSGFNYNAARGWGYGGRIHYLSPGNDNVLFVYGTNEFYYYFYFPGGLGLSNELVNIYQPGDIRLYYFSYPQGTGRKYYKYRPFPNRLSEPIRGFRVEEAFLNRAEAYAELNQPEKALDDINRIRRFKFDGSFGAPDYYKYTSTDFPTQESVIQAVRTERRKELCFEFHRWYDLRRYGMPKIVHSYGDSTFVLKQNDLRYTLQIPQRELDYNPKMEKNPR